METTGEPRDSLGDEMSVVIVKIQNTTSYGMENSNRFYANNDITSDETNPAYSLIVLFYKQKI